MMSVKLWEVVVDDSNVDLTPSPDIRDFLLLTSSLPHTWKEIYLPIDRIPNLKHPGIVALLEGFDKITYYKMKVR